MKTISEAKLRTLLKDEIRFILSHDWDTVTMIEERNVPIEVQAKVKSSCEELYAHVEDIQKIIKDLDKDSLIANPEYKIIHKYLYDLSYELKDTVEIIDKIIDIN